MPGYASAGMPGHGNSALILAAAQRGDYKGSVNCGRAATAALTILAGPLNYAGLNPHINCTVQNTSN